MYHYFRGWRREVVWPRIHDALRTQGGGPRQPVGEDNGQRGTRGYNAGKKVEGRKRIGWWIPGTCCWRWQCIPRPTGPGRRPVDPGPAEEPQPALQSLWAYAGYAGSKLGDWMRETMDWTLEIVRLVDMVRIPVNSIRKGGATGDTGPATSCTGSRRARDSATHTASRRMADHAWTAMIEALDTKNLTRRAKVKSRLNCVLPASDWDALERKLAYKTSQVVKGPALPSPRGTGTAARREARPSGPPTTCNP